MTVDRTRHGRQIRLPEIGEAGQERLDASEIVLTGAGEAREIEALYLRRAGARVLERAAGRGKVRSKASSSPKLPPGDAAAERLARLEIRDVAARAVADGALRALVAMRVVLGLEAEAGAEDGAKDTPS